jgi:hypothetical protein
MQRGKVVRIELESSLVVRDRAREFALIAQHLREIDVRDGSQRVMGERDGKKRASVREIAAVEKHQAEIRQRAEVVRIALERLEIGVRGAFVPAEILQTACTLEEHLDGIRHAFERALEFPEVPLVAVVTGCDPHRFRLCHAAHRRGWQTP